MSRITTMQIIGPSLRRSSSPWPMTRLHRVSCRASRRNSVWFLAGQACGLVFCRLRPGRPVCRRKRPRCLQRRVCSCCRRRCCARGVGWQGQLDRQGLGFRWRCALWSQMRSRCIAKGYREDGYLEKLTGRFEIMFWGESWDTYVVFNRVAECVDDMRFRFSVEIDAIEHLDGARVPYMDELVIVSHTRSVHTNTKAGFRLCKWDEYESFYLVFGFQIRSWTACVWWPR